MSTNWGLVFLPVVREGELCSSLRSDFKKVPAHSEPQFLLSKNVDGNGSGMLGSVRWREMKQVKSAVSTGLGAELLLGRQTSSSSLL